MSSLASRIGDCYCDEVPLEEEKTYHLLDRFIHARDMGRPEVSVEVWQHAVVCAEDAIEYWVAGKFSDEVFTTGMEVFLHNAYIKCPKGDYPLNAKIDAEAYHWKHRGAACRFKYHAICKAQQILRTESINADSIAEARREALNRYYQRERVVAGASGLTLPALYRA